MANEIGTEYYTEALLSLPNNIKISTVKLQNLCGVVLSVSNDFSSHFEWVGKRGGHWALLDLDLRHRQDQLYRPIA